MATATITCATNVDCLPLLYVGGNVSGSRNWCVRRTGCDATHLSCVTWDLCTFWPQIGCLLGNTPEETLCVNYNREYASATDGVNMTSVSHYATMTTPAVLIPTIIGIIVILVFVAVFLKAIWRLGRCSYSSSSSSSKKKQSWGIEEPMVPMVSLDGSPILSLPEENTQPLHAIEEEDAAAAITLREQHDLWTRFYNDNSLLY